MDRCKYTSEKIASYKWLKLLEISSLACIIYRLQRLDVRGQDFYAHTFLKVHKFLQETPDYFTV